MPRVDFTTKYTKETVLSTGVWYRSKLWRDDHLLGESSPFLEEGLAWCGRALGVAMDWEGLELGGLYISERKSGKCSQCNARQKEWDER